MVIPFGKGCEAMYLTEFNYPVEVDPVKAEAIMEWWDKVKVAFEKEK